jgi:hypothetical protein
VTRRPSAGMKKAYKLGKQPTGGKTTAVEK